LKQKKTVLCPFRSLIFTSSSFLAFRPVLKGVIARGPSPSLRAEGEAILFLARDKLRNLAVEKSRLLRRSAPRKDSLKDFLRDHQL
jgi:hypothetical protein